MREHGKVQFGTGLGFVANTQCAWMLQADSPFASLKNLYLDINLKQTASSVRLYTGDDLVSIMQGNYVTETFTATTSKLLDHKKTYLLVTSTQANDDWLTASYHFEERMSFLFIGLIALGSLLCFMLLVGSCVAFSINCMVPTLLDTMRKRVLSKVNDALF